MSEFAKGPGAGSRGKSWAQGAAFRSRNSLRRFASGSNTSFRTTMSGMAFLRDGRPNYSVTRSITRTGSAHDRA